MKNEAGGPNARRPDRRQREEAILTAALAVFKEKGFAAARMEDVAEQVGLSKPALYLYFKDKEDLLRSALLRTVSHSIEELEAVAETAAGDPVKKLFQTLDVVYKVMMGVDGHDGFATMIPVVAVTASRFPEMARFFRDECVRKMDAILIGIVQEGVEAGVFRHSLLAQQAELIIGPVMALGLRQATFGALDDGPPIDLDAYKSEHKRMLLAALAPEPRL